MMEYIHVKNLDKYQPGYTDRRHIWAKIYYETFLDEAVQGLSEIDRYRFWSLIVFEVYTQKPVPLTDTNLKIMGWNKSKHRIPLSLQMLHTLIEVRNTESKPTVTQIRVEESRVDKSIIGFSPPTISQINEYCKEKNIYVNAEKFINHYGSKGWMVGKNKMKNWQMAVCNAVDWDINRDKQPLPKADPKLEAERLEKRRQEVRDELGGFFREQTTEKLKAMLIQKNKKYFMQSWLIKEILQEREGRK